MFHRVSDSPPTYERFTPDALRFPADCARVTAFGGRRPSENGVACGPEGGLEARQRNWGSAGATPRKRREVLIQGLPKRSLPVPHYEYERWPGRCSGSPALVRGLVVSKFLRFVARSGFCRDGYSRRLFAAHSPRRRRMRCAPIGRIVGGRFSPWIWKPNRSGSRLRGTECRSSRLI
jgi:hypothetical protein